MENIQLNTTQQTWTTKATLASLHNIKAARSPETAAVLTAAEAGQ